MFKLLQNVTLGHFPRSQRRPWPGSINLVSIYLQLALNVAQKCGTAFFFLLRISELAFGDK